MKAAFKSDVGKVRSHNEDNGGIAYNKDHMLLAMVADGMGGHQAGDIASKMATELLLTKWQNADDATSPSSVETWLGAAISDINKEIYEYAQAEPNCQGMGTTLVAVVCTRQFVTYAHIGDSRAYLMNEQVFLQRTEDHSLVNELVRSGQITSTEAEKHPRRNVLLRALGTERKVKVDIKTIEWDEGSFLLLCSDGLSNKLKAEEMLEVLQNNESLEQMVTDLITQANERGGEDNITVALVFNYCEEVSGDTDDGK